MPAQLAAESPVLSEAPKSVLRPAEQQKPQVSEQAGRMASVIKQGAESSNPDPDSTLQKILALPEQPVNPQTETAKTEEKKDTAVLIALEVGYIQRKTAEDLKKFKGIEDRYEDKGSDSSVMKEAIDAYGKKAGLEHAQGAELLGKTFNLETRKQVGEQIQVHIDRLFNSNEGRKNPDKQASATWETQRYLDLILQAQAEGDISSSLDASAVLKLAERNVWQLAFQDRVASENLMGDHGVRHLIDHNIRVTEAIADSLQAKGQSVKTVDRIIMHQAMLDHDLGYATNTVREGYIDANGTLVKGINAGGFGIDVGHNLLSAKIIRQRLEEPGDPLGAIFSQKQLEVLHESILYHDDSKVDFRVGDNSEEARKANIESAVHVADNTHAFEDKLPELLYGFPDSLRVMRLLKTAGEIGDSVMVDQLKTQLIQSIGDNGSFSADDKEALAMAARSLSKDSYKFSVGRICGNKPEFDMDSSGKLTIQVTESAIHQETTGLFDQKSYDQLKKFIGDLTGKDKSQVDMNQDSIISANGKMEIRLKIGAAKATEQTDYQRRVEALIADSAFQEFILGGSESGVGDAQLSRSQLSLEADLKSFAPETDAYNAIAGRISEVKQQRLQRITNYMKGK